MQIYFVKSNSYCVHNIAFDVELFKYFIQEYSVVLIVATCDVLFLNIKKLHHLLNFWNSDDPSTLYDFLKHF